MTRPGSSGASPRRLCVIAHAYYDEHPRVRRQAEALVARGHAVDVFALRRPTDPEKGTIAGVHVRRLPVQRHQGAPLPRYLLEYADFLVRAMWAVTREHRRRRYALVQVHSPPDFLAFAALPLRLAGVPLVLDLHEAVPMFFQNRFPNVRNPLVHRAVALQEQLAVHIADAVMTVTQPLVERLVAQGIPAEKVALVLNSPDLHRFNPGVHPRRPFMADGVLRRVYAGALTPSYEVAVVLDALACLHQVRPELPVEFDVYGRGDDEERLEQRAAALGLTRRVRFHGRIPLEAVPSAVAASDVGVAPIPRNPFTETSLSTKILEYAAMGKPVVTSRLSTVGTYFPADTLWIYEPGDARDLADTLLTVVDDPADRSGRVARTVARARDMSWERESERYVALVERVARDGRRSANSDRVGGLR